jgi:hypothetical protein
LYANRISSAEYGLLTARLLLAPVGFVGIALCEWGRV